MVKRWLLFVLSLMLMGLWFPLSFFRRDERHFFWYSFGLKTDKYVSAAWRFDALVGPDNTEAAFNFAGDGSLVHKLKNIAHEWAKDSPKRAVKFLSFILLVQLVIIIVLAS